MAWIKGHLVVVICSALIVVALPVAYVMSKGWNTRLVKKQQKIFEKAWGDVNGLDVTYQVPPASSGGEALSKKFAPNEAMIKRYEEIIRLQREEVESVSLDALEFNRRGHGPLLPGLFPQPQSAEDAQTLPYEFVDLLRGSGAAPSVYDEMLKRFNAGGPLDPVAVQGAVARRSEEFRNQLVRERGPAEALSPQEQARLREVLSERRIDLYRRRAQNLLVYCDPETVKANEAGLVPASRPAAAPSLAAQFEQQWSLWMIEDLFGAIERANSDSGRRQNVESGVVKRIKSIEITRFSDGEETRPAALPALPEEAGVAGVTDVYSVTGRLTNPGNQVYDARFMIVTMVVDWERLPLFLRALRETNFMTITDLDVKSVDVWEDLKHGYYYGPSVVAEVTMEIESLWLRAWTRELMPAAVKANLGVTDPPGGTN